MTRLFEQTFPVELASMKTIRALLTSALKPIISSNEALDDCLLILTEYISNLARHQTHRDDTLTLTVDMSAENILIGIEDPLGYFDKFNTLIEQHREGKLTASLSGMGIPLIAKLLKGFTYEKLSDHKNRFSFEVPKYQLNTNPKVLVVDDDPVLLEVISGYLEGHYDCHLVEHSENVFEILEHQSMDMIISDIQMPGIGGIELRQRLSNSKSFRDIPFIFLTGCDQPEIEESAVALNIDDYLEKPVSKPRLLNVIQRVLNRSRALKESREFELKERHKSTLFKLPEVPILHYRVTSHSEHAEHAAGDFMLHHQIGEHHYFLLCDVMGHGYDAGFFSYGYAGYLRAQLKALNKPVSTGQFLSQVSDSFLEDELMNHSLVSMLICHICPEGIEISAAGHPPPMIVSCDAHHTLTLSGPLPGLMINAEYDSHQLNLLSGEKLLLFTDGILENYHRTDDESARSMLAQRVQQRPDDDAKGWMTSLQNASPGADKHLMDDASLLVIEHP